MTKEDRALELEKLLSDSFVIEVNFMDGCYVLDFNNGARLIVEEFSVEEE
jgi:hypothetical protein